MIRDEIEGLILIKEISSGYDDKTLEFEINKAIITDNVKYVFYDTLKQDSRDFRGVGSTKNHNN